MGVFERVRARHNPTCSPEIVDSRDYAVPFAVDTVATVPQGFFGCDLVPFHRGLFLPRSEPDRFGRSSYPPRLLLLTDSTLVILTHSSSGTPPDEIRLSSISSLETGNLLLVGWTGIRFERTEKRLEYNTRCFEPIGDLLRTLRQVAFPAVRLTSETTDHFGDELEDVKFSRAGDREIDPGEQVALSFLSLPRHRVSRRLLVHREIWNPGDLIVCTDRRLIWVTDRYRGLRERYGRVVRSVRFRHVRGILVERHREAVNIGIRLRDGGWSITVDRELEAAAGSFAQALTSAIKPSS